MKTKILVVEDEDYIRKVLRRLLTDDDTEVECVGDGAHALARIAEEAPDLVIMDVNMPRLNGFDACQALRDDQRTRNIPIILLTGLSDLENRIRGLKCGADEYVAKPIDPTWLIGSANSLLLRRRMKTCPDVLGQTRG